MPIPLTPSPQDPRLCALRMRATLSKRGPRCSSWGMTTNPVCWAHRSFRRWAAPSASCRGRARMDASTWLAMPQVQWHGTPDPAGVWRGLVKV